MAGSVKRALALPFTLVADVIGVPMRLLLLAKVEGDSAFVDPARRSGASGDYQRGKGHELDPVVRQDDEVAGHLGGSAIRE
jgi:hypothetical protein